MSIKTDTADVPDGFHGFLPKDETGRPDRIFDHYTDEGERIRLVAFYRESMQEWMLRKQVQRNGEWRTSMWGVQLEGTGPEDHPLRVRFLSNRYVKAQAGMFTGLSRLQRLLLAPVYGLAVAIMCARGKDVNLQTLHDEDWSPK